MFSLKKINLLIVIISLAVVLTGGIIGYVMLYNGVRITYSSVLSYDDVTQIGTIIVEPDEAHNRFGAERYGVVIAHGILGKAESNIKMACELAKAGFTVIAIDERGHGRSGGVLMDPIVGVEHPSDIVKCAEILQNIYGCDNIGLIGHSWGGMGVILASILAPEKSVDLKCTIAISAPNGVPDDGSEISLTNLLALVQNTFYFNMTLPDLVEAIETHGDIKNFLGIISNTDLMPVADELALIEAAGGLDKTGVPDFASGDASDLINFSGTDHGNIPDHKITISAIIDWLEKSIGLTNQYTYDGDAADVYWVTTKRSIYYAEIGGVLLIFPAYFLVRDKLLSKNRNKRGLKDKEDEEVVNSALIDTSSINSKNIMIFSALSLVAMFFSPLITKLFSIPVFNDYVAFNVILRDLGIAIIFIFVIMFLVFKIDVRKLFSKENAKKFGISLLAASIMLAIFLTMMLLFDTIQNKNGKWQPFPLIPFIPERFFVAIMFFLEFFVIIGIIEYFSRIIIQDNYVGLREKFGVKKTIKIAMLNSLIKGWMLALLIIGIYFAYDPTIFAGFFASGSGLIILFGLIIGVPFIFVIPELFLTITYHHSKDYWFVILCSYGFFAFWATGWLIRI